MDYVALHTHPLWKELWQSDLITEKVEAIKRQLLNDSVTDAHTLGKLRGQLDALAWLKHRIEAEAKLQMDQASGTITDQDERVAQINWLRKRRIV